MAASPTMPGVLRLDVQAFGKGIPGTLKLTVEPSGGGGAATLEGSDLLCEDADRNRCSGDVRVSTATGTSFRVGLEPPAGQIVTFDRACDATGTAIVAAGGFPTCEIALVPLSAGSPANANAAVELAVGLDQGTLIDDGLFKLAGQQIGLRDLCGFGCRGFLTFNAATTPEATLSETFTDPRLIALFSGGCAADGSLRLQAGRITHCGIDNVRIEAAAPSRLAIDNTSVTEGDLGTKTVNVPVSLDVPAFDTVTVNYQTVNGSATQPADYVSASGTLTIPAGEANATIPVQIVGDTTAEPAQAFTITLSSPNGATIGDGSAVVTIFDNDPDTTPPAIAAKLTVVVEARLAEGEAIAVLYTPPTATDNVDGQVGTSCTPPSGSKFLLGTTTVNCSARDKAGNTSASSFSVVVRLPTTSGAVTNPGNLANPLTSVAPGQRVRVTAGGFAPGSSVSLRFVTATGEVLDLGETTAGSDGRIDARPKIPESASPGPSQMTAVGANSAGDEFVRGWRLTVEEG